MKKFFLFVTVFTFQFFQSSDACTTILVTKGATEDGSLFVSHTDDNEFDDERIVSIPSRDYPKDAKRPVYAFDSFYPRFVGKTRGSAYDMPDYPATKPLGYIDQVSHTYAYFEGVYGIMNEHQLSIGECTDSTKFFYESDKGKRLLDIRELSLIALERCTKAKEAVQVMGDLAEQYGYYGWGETLLIADKEEGWIFEITGTPSGTGALWVAKKVPDGEVFVAANQFRIQEVLTDSPDMLFSKNLFQVAEEQKWWTKESTEPLNWVQAVCPGEFDHPYYSLRRVWRVFSLVNPSLHLSPWVQDAFTKDYPFSIKPEKKINLKDMFRFFRDHYEGTEFDMTKGLAAGPYGSPYRYLGTYDTYDFPQKRPANLPGAWERPISIYYSGYSYVNQIRGFLPDSIGGVSWIGFGEPYLTCYFPFYVGVHRLPASFQEGDTFEYNHHYAWWAFSLTGNWIAQLYGYASPTVVAKQKFLEKREFKQQKEIEKQALAIYEKDPEQVQDFLTHYCEVNTKKNLNAWWKLNKFLIERFNQGYIRQSAKVSQRVGYPEEWRNGVGYSKGPAAYPEPKGE